MEKRPAAFRIPRVSFAWFADLALFLSSYMLLFVALAFRFDCPQWLSRSCWILVALGGCSAVWILGTWRLRGRSPIRILTVEERGADVGGYLTTYLLPVAVIGAPTTRDIVAYAIVLCAIALVYMRAGLVYINPTLYLCGLRPYHVETYEGQRGYLLARKRPNVGDELEVVQRGNLMIRT